MPLDVKRIAIYAGIGASALVFGIAARGITEKWHQQSVIAAHKEDILRSPASYVAGNPNGDVSVVTFFDHNCPYCRKDAPALAKLVADDAQVRLVLKELPVLGADSEAVARVALAAGRQGKYFELYQRLFAEPGRATEEAALRVAGQLGLDPARIKQDMQDPAINAALLENMKLAGTLQVKGVPFYVVGDKALGDGTGDFYADITQKIADARAENADIKP